MNQEEQLDEAIDGDISPNLGTGLTAAYKQMVKNLKKDGGLIRNSLTPQKCSVIHMAMGISTEAGELEDAIKKWTIYEKTLDRQNVVEELGDLEFFLEGIRQDLGISREECLMANKHKLLDGKKARYKEGKFTNEQAHKRQDKE